MLETTEGGTCQTRKETDRGTLTNWRWQRDRCVRTRKETDRPRRTHQLETTEGGTCQDTQTNRPTEAHSPTGNGRRRDLSGHRKKPIDRGALTIWRRQREGLVMIRKETDRPRHTHQLETAEGGTCQDTQRTDRPRRTHILETAEGGACQDTQRNRPTEAHSLPGGGTGRDLSEHAKNRQAEARSHPGDSRGRKLSGQGKKQTDQGALTSWRRQREGLVRTWKEINRETGTHILETAEGGTCQDRNKRIEHRVLTNWRR